MHQAHPIVAGSSRQLQAAAGSSRQLQAAGTERIEMRGTMANQPHRPPRATTLSSRTSIVPTAASAISGYIFAKATPTGLAL